MQRRGLVLLVIGVCAALSALLVYSLGTNAALTGPATLAAPPVTPPPVQAVVLAARDIPARHRITAADVMTQEIAVSLVPSDTFAQVGEVVSRTTQVTVFAGQALLTRQFNALDERNNVSAQLPPGKVLVAFPATDMLNATGAVQPGDHVDILITLPISGTTALGGTASLQVPGGTRQAVTQATIQNVEVYSTGLWSPPGVAEGQPLPGSGTLKVITFIVDHQDALVLKYIKDSGGTVDLVLRSAAEVGSIATDPVSLDYLVELYRLANPSRSNP